MVRVADPGVADPGVADPGVTDPGVTDSQPVSAGQRWFAVLVALVLLAFAGVVFPDRAAATPAGPASATGADRSAAAAAAFTAASTAAALCSIEEWAADINRCLDELPGVAAQRAQCLKAPTPEAPDSGLGGWFAARPPSSLESGVKGPYSRFGYAGYQYTTYDIGCASTLMHPDYKFENTVANGELMLATAVIGASNAVRERAWDPGVMWGWADPLVEQATRSIYTRVFTVFGVVTLAVVGLYLLWRSRQAEMSAAMTTAGWAILVMVVVTALAAWPVFSAHLADKALISSLGVVHDAVGPPAKNLPAELCPPGDPSACQDNRPPAVRASDTAVETMLYRNWLRGLLGSADSATAQKYGQALYRARSLTWDEAEELRVNPQNRELLIKQKGDEWLKIAEQIQREDPEAYQYLTGAKGMERIGAGFIALIAAIMFALFDLTASLLVLLGFLIFRWAVIAAPVLGTVAILRPASAGFRRLLNAVVAALFNIIIFGTGAAIYLFAVDLIMSTSSLPGWLQVVLVFLCGVVGWLLLRPYRRVTQLGGRDTALAAITAEGRRSRAVRVEREAAATAQSAGTAGGDQRPAGRPQRVELRAETAFPPAAPPAATPESPDEPPPPPRIPRRRMPAPSGSGWSEPESPAEPRYVLYRPGRRAAAPADEGGHPGTRAEARRES
jgi:hypothetical protein